MTNQTLLMVLVIFAAPEDLSAQTPPPSFRMPFSAGETWGVSTGYGGSDTHQGRDYFAIDFNIAGDGDCGRFAIAAANGVIIRINTDGWGGGYGNYVDVDHGSGWVTRTTHLQSVIAVQGQEMEQGNLLGLVGTTGQSTGCHIHFVPYYQGTSVLIGMSGYESFHEGGQ